MFIPMKSALLVVLGTLLASCTPHRIALQPRVAPFSESQLGWLVENLKPEIAEQLSKNPEVQIQPISEKRRLYEIQGLKQKDILDLKHEHGDLKFQKNKFVHFAEDEAAESVELCSKGFFDGEPLKAPNTLVLGQSADIQQQVQHNEVAQAWLIETPLGSKLANQAPASHNLDFKPDMVGWFQILVLKPQANGLCRRSSASILVTSNPPFDPMESEFKDWSLFDDLPWYLNELQANQLWKKATGKDVVVAVLDSGINYRHRLLKNKIAINKKEIPGNGIDDDQNGYVDDVIGYDFIFGDEFPFDEENHGSHVSGLIVADQIGLAPNAKVLPLKAVTGMRSDYGSLTAAIYYAIDAKVRILNISAGQTNEPLPAVVTDALKEAERSGILVVTSAGNGSAFGLGLDIDRTPVYPASLGLKNILVVSASDRENALAPYANFGAKTVQVIAPGGMNFSDPMLSCYIENPSHIELFHQQGTSMATALVSGAAALLVEKHPELSAEDVIKRFIRSGEPEPGLTLISVSGKKFRPLDSF